MGKKKPGVISLFGACTIMLVLSFMFALLDGGRIVAMSNLAQPTADLAVSNILAGYQKEMYERFGILGIDQEFSNIGRLGNQVVDSMVEDELVYEKDLAKENRKKADILFDCVDLLTYEDFTMNDGKYRLLTDGEGEVFFKEASRYMLCALPKDTVTMLIDNYDEEKENQEKNDVKKIIASAKSALSHASAILNQQNNNKNGGGSEILSGEIMNYEQQRSTPVLSLVLGNEPVSDKSVDRQYCPTCRNLHQGTMPVSTVSVQEKILGIWYARRMFPNYLTKETKEPISYQLEYLIGGKRTDRENLEVVLEKLLAIREAVQFARHLADQKIYNRAGAIATMLVGFTGNPAIIKAVQMGILVAWSFDAAVDDVRKLLDGKKVALYKEDSKQTIGYLDYLSFLLYIQSWKQTGMRSLDVMENIINYKLKRGEFQADKTITEFEGTVTMKEPFLFAGFITLGDYTFPGIEKKVKVKGQY
ncbi:MAG: DUF5702 domain-containing protein [Lachnospiraceae bacterium]|nr:DUF5702 domain-containing protein [Lachnospiraceae bacterium]